MKGRGRDRSWDLGFSLETTNVELPHDFQIHRHGLYSISDAIAFGVLLQIDFEARNSPFRIETAPPLQLGSGHYAPAFLATSLSRTR